MPKALCDLSELATLLVRLLYERLKDNPNGDSPVDIIDQNSSSADWTEYQIAAHIPSNQITDIEVQL